MGSELLTGEDIVVRYRERTVLSVERIALQEGEIFAVLGPNGAGKSTLMRVLAMLEEPSGGRVYFHERTGPRAEALLRRSSAAVFQRPYLWSGTVSHNVALGLRFRGVPTGETDQRVARICSAMGIGDLEQTMVSELSGGEAQRVALARALVLEPEVLFLDEPTSNLDTEVRAALRQDIERHARSRAGSTLLVTHDRREAFYLADRIAVLEGGRLVQVGTPTELYENPATLYIAALTGAELALRGRVLDREEGLLTVSLHGVALRAVGSGERDTNVKIAYRPEDLVLADPADEAILDGAGNSFFSDVAEIRALGGLVRVRLEGPPPMVALVSRPAADQIGLRPGVRVAVRIKAAALRAFPL